MSKEIINLLSPMRKELDSLKKYCLYYPVDEENVRLVLFTVTQIQCILVEICSLIGKDNNKRLGPSARSKIYLLLDLGIIEDSCFDSVCTFVDIRNECTHSYRTLDKKELVSRCIENWNSYENIIESLYRKYCGIVAGNTVTLTKSNLF